MTQDEERILHQFEAKVRTLIEKHKALKEENLRLQQMLEERSVEITALEDRRKAAEQVLNDYKTGRMLELTSGDVESARSRMAGLIREVDKCISLLNV